MKNFNMKFWAALFAVFLVACGGSADAGIGAAPIVLSRPGPIGNTTPSTGAFTALSASDVAITGGSINGLMGPVNVSAPRTTINTHAFEDQSVLNTTDTGLGYADFDAYAEMANALHQDHFHGYQSRNTYTGAGTLNNMYGYWSAPRHVGTGNITNSIGVRIGNPSGTGPISSVYGLFVDDFNTGRGSSNNYAAWFSGGEVHSVGSIISQSQIGISGGGYFSAGTPASVGVSTYTVPAGNNYINSYYAGTLTLALPTAASFPGRRIVVKTTTNNAVISGLSDVYPLATNVLGYAIVGATAGSWAELISNGVTWTIMSGN